MKLSGEINPEGCKQGTEIPPNDAPKTKAHSFTRVLFIPQAFAATSSSLTATQLSLVSSAQDVCLLNYHNAPLRTNSSEAEEMRVPHKN